MSEKLSWEVKASLKVSFTIYAICDGFMSSYSLTPLIFKLGIYYGHTVPFVTSLSSWLNSLANSVGLFLNYSLSHDKQWWWFFSSFDSNSSTFWSISPSKEEQQELFATRICITCGSLYMTVSSIKIFRLITAECFIPASLARLICYLRIYCQFFCGFWLLPILSLSERISSLE